MPTPGDLLNTDSEIEREVVKILSQRGKVTDLLKELSDLRNAQLEDGWRWDEKAAEAKREAFENELLVLQGTNDELEEMLEQQKSRIWELKRDLQPSRHQVQDLKLDVELLRVSVDLSCRLIEAFIQACRMSFNGRTAYWTSSTNIALPTDPSIQLPYEWFSRLW